MASQSWIQRISKATRKEKSVEWIRDLKESGRSEELWSSFIYKKVLASTMCVYCGRYQNYHNDSGIFALQVQTIKVGEMT